MKQFDWKKVTIRCAALLLLSLLALLSIGSKIPAVGDRNPSKEPVMLAQIVSELGKTLPASMQNAWQEEAASAENAAWLLEISCDGN